MKTITDKNIVLTFADKETADCVKLVCKRKGTTIEDYIIDNFEWDEQLPCLENVTKDMCDECDFSTRCPDFIK